jgi:hypothetical protein
MRALGGFAVLFFFGLLGAAFVIGLAGWKGSDPRPAAGYYLGIFAAILLASSLLGLVGSAAALAGPERRGDEIPVPATKGREQPPMAGRNAEPDTRSGPDTAIYPPPPRAERPSREAWGSRYSAGVGLVVSILMGAVALWVLNVASNLAQRNFFTGKPRAAAAHNTAGTGLPDSGAETTAPPGSEEPASGG